MKQVMKHEKLKALRKMNGDRKAMYRYLKPRKRSGQSSIVKIQASRKVWVRSKQ